ncbi:MAG: hypothetical protein ACI92E_000988 [Oceanicoccus sp.]|jgi:hypothetical protein
MSSLIFTTNETQILVATDTLAVNVDGDPHMFVSKATHIPHLKTIIAGFGAEGFTNEWALIVSTKMIVNGILNLDYHTPAALRNLWVTYSRELPEELTATVYQFGISEVTNRVAAFVYRSENGFESEPIEYGTVVLPECTVPRGNIIQAIPEMMNEQRDNQLQLPKGSRLAIGGEIYALYLTGEGCNSFKIAQFDDYDAQQRAVFNKFEMEQR